MSRVPEDKKEQIRKLFTDFQIKIKVSDQKTVVLTLTRCQKVFPIITYRIYDYCQLRVVKDFHLERFGLRLSYYPNIIFLPTAASLVPIGIKYTTLSNAI